MKYSIIFFLIFTGQFIYCQEYDKPFELINKSKHKVELIFDSKSPEGLFFRAELFRNWQIYKTENSLILHFPLNESKANQIHILNNSIIVKKGIFVNRHYTDTLKNLGFRTNTIYAENDSAYMDIVYIFDTTEFKFKDARIEVIQHGARCEDSGINSVKIKYDSDYIVFKHMNNIKVFQYDLNKNGEYEIYVINFSCCDGKLKIYRVI